ncbi:Diaminopimelate epimerase-like protein [Lophiostoma macrostomum CBS 122681]|uniref:Diaminopimelate epimerase-like protein n=1 Tax=Lophiostoma macrostomum CBS 122681 TaxID=1314788 RepID=A0A6A6T0A9_9PLEO|nr:Diaminopimelate epimerase-like protein [Lophiostoma macrostomum CBS 122681]
MSAKSIQLDFVTVDVFTQRRYEGNPLAIVTVPRGTFVSQDQKQVVAREFNLSETTFVHPPDGDGLVWTVDIFTTFTELPFAGHPTIGTACNLLSNVAEARGAKDGKIEAKFNIKAGTVSLTYDVAKRSAIAAIPHNFHIHERTFSKEELLQLQPGLADIALKEAYPIVSVVKGMTFILIELEDEETLGKVAIGAGGPSVDGLDKGWETAFIGPYYFCRSGNRHDGATYLRTRMVTESLEDPATGSAASDLAGYLSLTEGKAGQAIKYAITQGVEMGRRSDIELEIIMGEKSGIADVYLQGSAVSVMQGSVTV